jgi:hypothetical protein
MHTCRHIRQILVGIWASGLVFRTDTHGHFVVGLACENFALCIQKMDTVRLAYLSSLAYTTETTHAEAQ